LLSEYPQTQLTTSEFNFGKLLGGWLAREGELASQRGRDEIILFGKYTVLPGRRAELNSVLLDGLAMIDKEEIGTRSILLIESENDENVSYVMERFADEAAIEAHGKGSGAAKAMSLFQEVVTNREGGFCTEIV
jgi:quinol monooxygenase YgiN